MCVHFVIEWQTGVMNIWTMNVIEFTENDSMHVWHDRCHTVVKKRNTIVKLASKNEPINQS